jgi:hypothetical protein
MRLGPPFPLARPDRQAWPARPWQPCVERISPLDEQGAHGNPHGSMG